MEKVNSESSDEQYTSERHYRGPVISFGFGGISVSTGGRNYSSHPSTRMGSVVVGKISTFAKNSAYAKALEEFPGPFPTNAMDHFGVKNATSVLKNICRSG